MRVFRLAYTGDFLNDQGESAYGDLGLAPLDAAPFVQYHVLHRQAPRSNDATYWQQLYSMQVEPDELCGLNAVVVLRPSVRREAIAAAADELVVIGRSSAGYDKINVEACTEHDVALFNVPMALNHATGSTALMFMLALAKRLPQQERLGARAGGICRA